jgi:hypothetical protein
MKFFFFNGSFGLPAVRIRVKASTIVQSFSALFHFSIFYHLVRFSLIFSYMSYAMMVEKLQKIAAETEFTWDIFNYCS